MIEKITNKIDATEAVKTLSKRETTALMVVFLSLILFLIGLLLYQAKDFNVSLKKEKDADKNECAVAQTQLRRDFDSVRTINEQLHDSVVEYRMFRRFNMQQFGSKEIIITAKKNTK